MAFPDIRFNASTGADTGTSGSGPATPLTGTAASYTGSVFTLDGSPDLTNVAVDGSHVILVNTSTGRQFFKITAKDNGAKTVTVANAPAGTTTGLTWAIGGKRASLGATQNRLLGTADALPGWTITLETDMAALTSAWAATVSGDATNGTITLRGDSTAVANRRLLTTATNNVSLLSGGLRNWKIQNLKFESTAATKTTSYGVLYSTDSASDYTLYDNCTFGHATNTLQHAIYRDTTSQRCYTITRSIVQYCISHGLRNSGGGSANVYRIVACDIHHNGGDGIHLEFGGLGDLVIDGNTIWLNGGNGIYMPNNVSQTLRLVIRHNTINGNGSKGIYIEDGRNILGAEIVNNQLTNNTSHGLFGGASVSGELIAAIVDYNNIFGNGTPRNGFAAGANDLAVDPGYTNAAAGDFTIGTATKGVGFPAVIGQISGTRKNFVDLGALQREEPTAGGPIGANMRGGFSNG